jgi:hypothetical protein
MNTLINSSSNVTYLYKDGILDPRITLPTGITNTGTYLINNGGNVTLDFAIPEIIGKSLFIKCLSSTSPAANQYFLLWKIGSPNKYEKLIFDNANGLNEQCYLGLDFSNANPSDTQRISFTGNSNKMMVYEIFYF